MYKREESLTSMLPRPLPDQKDSLQKQFAMPKWLVDEKCVVRDGAYDEVYVDGISRRQAQMHGGGSRWMNACSRRGQGTLWPWWWDRHRTVA